MADFINNEDILILRVLAKRYEQRNIIGQMRQILSDEDAILATKTLNKVADRIEEIGRQYPDGVPLKMEKRHEQA